jgi:tRNA U34 5-methylaminomethyl-2-thiouridine-forming methyltransferase MnmC
MASQALVKYRVHKSSNEFEPSKDVVIHDANTGQPVVWEPIECEVPAWFAATVDRISLNLIQFNLVQ